MKRYIPNRGMVDERDLVDARADHIEEERKERRIEHAFNNEADAATYLASVSEKQSKKQCER